MQKEEHMRKRISAWRLAGGALLASGLLAAAQATGNAQSAPVEQPQIEVTDTGPEEIGAAPASPAQPNPRPVVKPLFRPPTAAPRQPSIEMPKVPLINAVHPAVSSCTTCAGSHLGLASNDNVKQIGYDGEVTPPDQGLAAGTSSAGPAVLQFLNASLQVFRPSGTPLTVPVSASSFFRLGPCSATQFPLNCLSDPRVYWDPQTRHWFITSFTFASFVLGPTFPPSTQYVAVSRTSNALGSYTIFKIPMGPGFIDPADCPCVGDFDMIGADRSGFYLDVNEFGQTMFHGTDLFAVSKSLLISAARGGPVPPVFLYQVPTLADPFGGFRLAPSVVTQGSAAPNDEYFVEADANTFSDTSLQVWALLGTDSLNVASAPPLVESNVATEGYSTPPPATQKAGPIPFGNSLGFLAASPVDSGPGTMQQNTTFASGNLYVQMGTGVNAGGGAANAGLAWFVLRPRPGTSSVSVRNLGNGYVHVNGMLIYPSISVNARGHGYMGFAIGGASRFPGAAYIRFDGALGAVGPIHIAANGRTPLDDFSCYPAAPTCRYGDYSAGTFFNGRLFFGTEYVHTLTNVAAGAQSNWASRVWSVPSWG